MSEDAERKVYWHPDPPPAFDEWVNTQVEQALTEYIHGGYFMMDWDEEDGVVLVCCLAEQAMHLEKSQTFDSFLEEELDLRRAIEPDFIAWMEGVKKAFERAAKRLDEEIARSGQSG